MDEVLICKYKDCNKYLSQPVILPCGNNICKAHVDEILQNSKLFKCDLCKSIHEIPENGFILNKALSELLKSNAHFDDKGKEAQDLIYKFEEVLNELLVINKDPEAFISDYISITKNKIDSERDRIISELKDVTTKMMNKVESFEKDCKKYYKNLGDLIERNRELEKHLEEKYSEFRELIRTPRLNKERMNEFINDIGKSLQDSLDQLVQYKNKLLLNKKAHFNPKSLRIDEDSFGKLEIDGWKDLDLIDSIADESGLFLSKILNASQTADLIKLCGFSVKDKFHLIYRASEDGFSAHDFHRKCDGISKTLILVKSKKTNNVFGGYTEAKWDSSSLWVKDQHGFVFSLINEKEKPIKFDYKSSIYCNVDQGPIFGGQFYNDFYIVSNSNENENSSSNLGHNMHHELLDDEIGLEEGNKLLAGSQCFSTSEIEVFQRTQV